MAKINRVVIREQEAEDRIHNFDEVVFGYSETEAKVEASRCLQCKNKPCSIGCPIGVKVPEFLKLVAQGDFVEAGMKVKESHLFPSICGRVCPQELQCESKCVLSKAGGPLAIGTLERFVGDWLCEHNHQDDFTTKIKKNGKKVAIIGTGPAGLTVASETIKNGFEVTMFEALHDIGGVLIYGIPDFRLPKQTLKTELVQFKKYGVEIVPNFVVGKTATVDELLTEWGFDAVFIGSGAGLPVFMDIPGEYSTGVYSANEYLTRVNLMRAHIKGRETGIMRGKTVVVGGGNIAMDAARVAVRLGCETTLVYRRGENEMPARKEEVRHAKEEGVDFRLLTNPIEILADDKGIVKGIRCVKMQLEENKDSGRKNVTPIKGSEFDIPCDVIVMALGNKSNPLIQTTTPDLKTLPSGTILSSAGDGRTSKKFVYVAGDVLTGASTVISAIATGKKASQSIIEDLCGNKPE